MLVLSRMNDEEIVVGDPEGPIGVIRVVEIREGKVRIGLEFPKSIPLNRREVAEAIVQERRVARENSGAVTA